MLPFWWWCNAGTSTCRMSWSQCDSRYTIDVESFHCRKPNLTLVVNQKKHQCNQCPKSFDDNSNLLRHVKSIHEKNKYYCKKCQRTISARSDSVKRHNETICASILLKDKKLVETKKKERKISEKNMKRKNPFENLLENSSATFGIKVEELKRRYEKNKINNRNWNKGEKGGNGGFAKIEPTLGIK